MSRNSTVAKTKARTPAVKRQLERVVTPPPPDSDPEFNNTVWHDSDKDPITGKKKRKSAAVATKRKRGVSKVVESEEDEPEEKPKKARRKRPQPTSNPLAKYFDHIKWDMHSASEGEGASPSRDGFDCDADDDDEEEDEELSDGSDHSRPPSPYPKQKKHLLPPSVKAPVASTSKLPVSRKRKASTSPLRSSPPMNRVAVDDGNSGVVSLTESENENLGIVSLTESEPEAEPTQNEGEDSATEEEPEEEAMLHGQISDQAQNPRPGFPLAPGQQHIGPYALDAEQRDIQIPASQNTYIRPYQREGVKFLYERYKESRGGLLGDDMGLGKTVQVISFLSAIMKKHGDKRDRHRRYNIVSKLQDDDEDWRRNLPPADRHGPTALIIAPSSVVLNWKKEFKTWGYFEVGVYLGQRKDRAPVLANFKMGRLDVVLTSLETARKDIDLLDELPWSVVFVDEVHMVKNPKSKTNIAYDQFLCMRRFGLTGTAIQNTYEELYAIVNWCCPEQLGSMKQWKGYISKPLTEGQSSAATLEASVKAKMVADILHKEILPNFFLRRTKDIIKHQLPKKIDQVAFCPLTSKQIEVYKRILACEEVENLLRRDEMCDCGSQNKRKKCCFPIEKGALLCFMSILIKLANHLCLLLPVPGDTAEQTHRNRELAKLAFPNGDAPKYGLAQLDKEWCGKWAVLHELLTGWRQDPTNKVLIFTKSKKLLDMLKHHLDAENHKHVRIDGDVKREDRMAAIEEFHNNPNVFIFLISTLAGGTGLNLQGANKVVIFDPNWNPAHDLQAMDRAYRFGQLRDVHVYRLLGAGSVEELIYARQIYKQQQMKIAYDASVQTRYFEGVKDGRKGELFGIENIFKLHEEKLAMKMVIEKATSMELNWALANMSSKKKKVGKMSDADGLLGDEADIAGLESFLFDDVSPAETAEQKRLRSAGVDYMHRNDDILRESRIEEAQRKKGRHSAGRKSHSAAEENNPSGGGARTWPPVFKRTKRNRQSPDAMLESRQQTIVDLGWIKGPSDMASFARKFARMDEDRQKYLLAELDEYSKHNL